MLVISIIYIFMIKRRKYIILDLWALVGVISVARTWWLVLVCKSSPSGETFIGQDGGGEPINTRWSFDRSSFLTGQCNRESKQHESCYLTCYLSVRHVTSGISVLHHDPCSSSPAHRGLLAGPCKQSGPAMTDMHEWRKQNTTVVCVCGSAVTNI